MAKGVYFCLYSVLVQIEQANGECKSGLVVCERWDGVLGAMEIGILWYHREEQDVQIMQINMGPLSPFSDDFLVDYPLSFLDPDR